tara:strand:+ start:364 stop:1194 length:831 start_codon:yes stop_codon:yes gene_type:complete
MVEIIDNKLQQAYDFRDECNAVYSILENLKEQDYEMPTQFKGWTFNNVIGHLHVWNYAADISLKDGDEWKNFANSALQALGNGSSMNEFEQTITKGIQGPELLSMWKEYYTDMTERFAVADPKKRVKWMGPDMSVRSSISARHMETWAHAQELYDSLGLDRINEDRIKNIVIIGNNTFKWCFTVHKKSLPSIRPYLKLISPSGEIWEYNEFSEEHKIEGLAEEFCQVVTQVRNIQDVNLKLTGSIAEEWMSVAQCFAGGAEQPPKPGTRKKIIKNN